MTVENRKQPRVPLEVEVSLESDSNFYTGITGNVSEGGVFVATYTAPPIGALVSVRLKLGEREPFELTGRVCWARPVERAAEHAPAGCGIRFSELSRDAEAAIKAFVSKRDSIFFDAD